MHIIRKNIKLITFGIAGLFSLLMINNTVFLHAHKLNDGRVVYHAHPFSHSENQQNPGENHQHSNGQILVLDQLSQLKVLTSTFQVLCDNTDNTIVDLFREIPFNESTDDYYFQLFGRPPPFLI